MYNAMLFILLTIQVLRHIWYIGISDVLLSVKIKTTPYQGLLSLSLTRVKHNKKQVHTDQS